jgi:hypothetical protein
MRPERKINGRVLFTRIVVFGQPVWQVCYWLLRRRVGVALFLLVFWMVVFAALQAWALRRRFPRTSWPVAAANVISFRVLEYPFSVLPCHALAFTYNFYVAGERYGGRGTWRFLHEPDAQAAAERLKNCALTVRYDPREPDRSVLV